MAKTYREIYAATSARLREDANALGVFSQPAAKGDGREDLVRALLADHVGHAFGVAKAEIIDSRGSSSREHDAVVFDHEVAASLSLAGVRRIVTVESVALIVEVKSILDGSMDAVANERARLDELAALHRWYRLTPLVASMYRTHVGDVRMEIDQFIANGIGARETHRDNVNAIGVAYFGFSGCETEVKATALARALGVEIVCSLGGVTVAQQGDGSFIAHGLGDDGRCPKVRVSDCSRHATGNLPSK